MFYKLSLKIKQRLNMLSIFTCVGYWTRFVQNTITCACTRCLCCTSVVYIVLAFGVCSSYKLGKFPEKVDSYQVLNTNLAEISNITADLSIVNRTVCDFTHDTIPKCQTYYWTVHGFQITNLLYKYFELTISLYSYLN